MIFFIYFLMHFILQFTKKEKETRKEFYFDANEKVWKPIGIMLRYFLPESDTFELYEELSKEKALEVIS